MAATGENRAPELLGVVITMLALGGLFVFARTITRTLLRPSLRWDDILIIITWFINLGFSISILTAVRYGYGRPLAELTPESAVKTLRMVVVSEVLAVWTYPTGKASIAYLLLRIFPGRRLKWILWTFVALNVFLFYASGLLILFQCHPVKFNWDRSIAGGSCWNPNFMLYWGGITGVFGAVTDFVFATLPWHYIRRLQMVRKEKISVGIALSMGLLATICCVVKIKLSFSYWSSTDVTYDTVPLNVWGSAEMGLINVAACIPTLRPMYLWLTGRDPQGGSAKPPTGHRARKSASLEGYKDPAQSSWRSVGSNEPKSSIASDSNIYHARSFGIHYEDVDETQPEERGKKSFNAETSSRSTMSV